MSSVGLRSIVCCGCYRQEQRARLTGEEQEAVVAIERYGLIILGVNQQSENGWRREPDALDGIGEQSRSQSVPAKS